MGRLVKGLCICGHRGERVSGAENTISALRHVMEAGVDMVETDVRMSSDGHLFLMHNRNLADCTDSEGRIENHTKDEILGMNAAVRSDGSHPYIPSFEHPALFEDFLYLSLKHPNVILNIEFKDLPGQAGISEEFAFEAVEKAVDMILDFGLGDRTLINSFSGRLVEHVFRKHEGRLHYHTFYPWENNGEMPWCCIPCRGGPWCHGPCPTGQGISKKKVLLCNV